MFMRKYNDKINPFLPSSVGWYVLSYIFHLTVYLNFGFSYAVRMKKLYSSYNPDSQKFER